MSVGAAGIAGERGTCDGDLQWQWRLLFQSQPLYSNTTTQFIHTHHNMHRYPPPPPLHQAFNRWEEKLDAEAKKRAMRRRENGGKDPDEDDDKEEGGGSKKRTSKGKKK